MHRTNSFAAVSWSLTCFSIDLAQDYVDLAASYQGLGYLESGITEPLNRFAERMLDFSGLLKSLVSSQE